MFTNLFQFVLVIRSADGRMLTQEKIDPDWEPAGEWTQFSAWRKSGLAGPPSVVRAVIEPVAHRTMDAPFTKGFRVTLIGEHGTLASCEFPITYFHSNARAISADLVKRGQLAEGETFNYLLMAFALERKNAGFASRTYDVTDVSMPPPLKSAAFGALAAESTAFSEHTAGDIPLFVSQPVIEETAALTARAEALETGGILIGHLCRDEVMPELGVLVTAQIPVRHAESEMKKLTFTAATWAAVHAAIALRNSDELFVGWWHSHPAKYWCNPKCPPERRRVCPLTKSFFSEDDIGLHKNVFASAFHCALVVTNTDDGLKHAMFGWREGVVGPRGFHVPRNDRPLLMPAIHNQEVIHATPCP